jgi:hypothetical protein
VVHTGEQAPATQDVDPFGFVHVVPHEPQLLVLVLRFVRQPLFGLPPQTAYPALQTGVQTPATHDVVPFGFEHVTPHAPQLVVELEMLVSQPLLGFPSQSA